MIPEILKPKTGAFQHENKPLLSGLGITMVVIVV